ncbi:MAG: pyrroline-5-carboxylate reductase dimerization domain-containing protein, partial [Acidimicrobiales bacterium]
MNFQLIIIGGGRMGSALAQGLISAKWCKPTQMAIVEMASEQRSVLEEQLPGVAVFAGLELEHVSAKTGAVLCVKPDQAEATARLAGAMGFTRVLSVVAGLSTARLEASFPESTAVIRSMPNTPVLVGKGVSAIAGGSHVVKDDLDWAESILGAVGMVVRVSERNIDAVSGLSGPMPAYLFLVVESLIEAGVHQGLSREVAKKMVIGTFEGSAALLMATGESPEELRA